MIGILSTYLVNALLNDQFNGQYYYCNKRIYCALSTTAINNDGTGVTEPTGNNYSRLQINFNPASYEEKYICNDIDYKYEMASGDWGIITNWALFDDATSGNMLAFGELKDPKYVKANQTIEIPENSLIIQIPTKWFTRYFVQILLNKTFLYLTESDNSSLTKYLGLSNTLPTVNETGITEPDDIGYLTNNNSIDISCENDDLIELDGWKYSRVELTGLWDTSIDNQVSINTELPVPNTELENIVCVFVSDALYGGNILAYGLVTPFNFETDDSIQPNITIKLK